MSASADALMREAFPLHQAGNIAAAEALYRRILGVDPTYADALYLLGSIERERGEVDRAVGHWRQAIASKPREPAFHQALAQLFHAQARWREAVAYFSSGLLLDPAQPENWNDRGLAHQELGEYRGALECFERALAVRPDFPPALNNAGNLLRTLGRVEEALALLQRLCEVMPEDPALHSNYLFTLNLSLRHSREQVAQEHRAYGRHFVPAPVPSRRARGAGERLRVGYFSPDLRGHPVAAFIGPVLRHHDRARFEISCFHLHAVEDEVSGRMRQHCDRWLNGSALTDEQLALAIEEAGIDLLVDLAGHTSGNRLPALARKPAPVIATWLGYLNTTGLPAVDFRITDAGCDPAGAERYHTEQLVRLPHGHSCFERPGFDIPVAPLPALRAGHVCFGSFNKASKLNEPTLRLWARLLQGVAGSTLLVVGVEAEQRQALLGLLMELGIGQERVECLDRVPLEPLLELHARVDIALDTHPYNGTTTTFNSLWMGVPVLTLAGEGAISRSAASILGELGLACWIAATPDDYVRIGVAKASDLKALARARQAQRSVLERSPLMDGPAFTRDLERSYLEMWES